MGEHSAMKRQVLFVHGGGEGAHEEDKILAASLQSVLGAAYEVRSPEMPDEDSPEYGAWRDRISQELTAMDGEVFLVGHSLGGSVLLKYLSEEKVEKPVVGIFLIAAPYWGAEDWQVSEYELREDFASTLPGGLPAFFYHSRDDEVVPFIHLALYKERFPQATIHEFDGRGHQFDDNLSEVARDIERLQGKYAMTENEGNYAEVNGLEMYYEVHGSGDPLVVLHGAYMTIDGMGELVSALAETRRVIAVELQGHGRTADIDRPITYEHMADDVAALLRHLEIEAADVFGYSMGGGVALQVAVRHPEAVRKLVVASASYASDHMHAELLEMIPSITPEAFAGSPFEEDYLRTAPNPEDFPTLVAKLRQLDMQPFAWPQEDIRGISAPTLLIIGDSDVVRLEHAVELFRLLGGGVMGDLAGLPNSQLAVLPGTAHFIPPGKGVLDRADWLLLMIPPFLDVPMPETASTGGDES